MQETGFDSWVGKIPWRRKWQATPVFLPGEFHGENSILAYRIPTRGAWRATVYGVAKSQTLLSDLHFTLLDFILLQFHPRVFKASLGKRMRIAAEGLTFFVFFEQEEVNDTYQSPMVTFGMVC